jgi:hypothetical protein
MSGLHAALAKGPTIAALKVEKKKRTPEQAKLVTLNKLVVPTSLGSRKVCGCLKAYPNLSR